MYNYNYNYNDKFWNPNRRIVFLVLIIALFLWAERVISSASHNVQLKTPVVEQHDATLVETPNPQGSPCELKMLKQEETD